MAVKKTQLYASLWASCDQLRGGMDSSVVGVIGDSVNGWKK